jgi:exodeoxyribonuclease V alpha subunit
VTQPLHPRGTLRARFEPVATGELFRKLGIGARTCDLGDQGLYLAEELVKADAGWLGAGDHPEALAILVLALMIAQKQGSTCLPLDRKGPLRTLVGDITRIAKLPLEASKVLKTIANLTGTPRFNSVIGVGDARVPLIVENDALYTERSRWLEKRVAERLATRMTGARRDVKATLAELNARPGARPLSDEQSHAVGLALASSLAVITGGPGTGKTVVAAAIVRGLAMLGVQHVALAAQTGKAANRLTEVIADQLATVVRAGHASAVDTALAASPPVAQTMHRLLGYGGRSQRFAHHAQSPLPVGAVIVDEASMIDLELMDALLDALPASAPLILIGDANQLPAIDAGQILADLATPEEQLRAPVAVLAKSYRMDTADPAGRAVYELSRAVQSGELAKLGDRASSPAVARTPGTLAFTGAEWVDTTKARRPLEVTLQVAETAWHAFNGRRALDAAQRVFRFVDGRIDPAQVADLEALWTMLGRGRLLTVTRALPTGSIAINEHLHELALAVTSVSMRPEFVPGEPVMITANDYERGLFNGDQGIVVRADEGLDKHHFRAVFRIGGELRPFAIEALRDRLEHSWALTVHKSQGSELDKIALLLPHDDLPLVTRELIYTGVTRARTGAVLCGAKAVLVGGAKRGALRHSGLGDRIRAKLG